MLKMVACLKHCRKYILRVFKISCILKRKIYTLLILDSFIELEKKKMLRVIFKIDYSHTRTKNWNFRNCII